MKKPRVLFICVHNSGRSQIAEAYLKKMAADQYEVESAGLEPAKEINPLVMQKVREIREMIKEKLVETVDKGFA